MVCPGCGIDVAENQKFCHECGTAIPTTAIDADLPTLPIPTEPSSSEAGEPAPLSAAELTTSELAPPVVVPADAADPVPLTELPDPVVPSEVPTTEIPTPDAPTVTTTAEMPAMLFDGSTDLEDYPEPREPFRVRVEFILALFGAAAVLMTLVADVTDIRTTRPAAGIATGATSLDGLGTSLGPAAIAGASVMVVGALLACFGLRWGAGLAGGGGLALVGWAGLTIGLAELPIAIAESITRTSSEEFTLRVTRDVGWGLVVGVGVIALLVFAISLRSIGTGGRRALNPIVAAVTAVAMVVLAFGPLVPVGDASFADNFRSPDPERDLPTLFFTGRLGQVGLIALAGVVGLLIVRSYGLGLAAGGVSVAVVLWALSIGEVGNRPVGIADRNPGASDTVPHAVTTAGMVSTLVLLAITAAFAAVRLRPRSN
jgi:MFS family permease